MQLTGDAGLEVRVPVTAGPRVVGVSFVRELWEPEGLPQPLQRGRVLTNDQIYMGYAAVGAVEIGGPHRVDAHRRRTRASRRRIFVCEPTSRGRHARARDRILSRMARLAYRRAVTTGRSSDAARVLRDRPARRRQRSMPASSSRSSACWSIRISCCACIAIAGGAIAGCSDVELASRLSFFLWSSIPDERAAGRSPSAASCRSPRSSSSRCGGCWPIRARPPRWSDDFAAQWLNLRRVDEVVVHPDFYPDFDDNLLEAFKQETELFIASTLREDRSVSDLLRADYTFVNERLARHYRIPGIYGTRFRRVTLPNPDQRGGLLGARRDARHHVVSRSHLAGAARQVAARQHLRRLRAAAAGRRRHHASRGAARHAAADHSRAAGAASHQSGLRQLPRGDRSARLCARELRRDRRLAERSTNRARPVDAVGTHRQRRADRRAQRACARCCCSDPDQFPTTVTEKLLAYALGRRLEYYDRPAVRQIVRAAAAHDYRWSSLILGIVNSPTFLMRGSS